MYKERERDLLKELAHGIIKAWQVQNLQVGPAEGRLGEELQFKRRQFADRSPFPRVSILFLN